MDFVEFVPAYNRIKAKGFIKSHRKGDTGVGHTFEQELGLTENCISGPDIDGKELKAARKGAGGKQTLFTKEGEWQIGQLNFIEKYGFPHNKYPDEMSAQSTVTRIKNNRGFWIHTGDKYVSIKHEELEIVRWNWNSLIDQFAHKFPACVKVFADVQKRNGVEYFHYNEAYKYTGTDKNLFRKAIEDDIICIDLRLRTQYNVGSGQGVRNRGTAFRINHDNMDKLFIKEVLE
jgi:hypothetical protein